MNVLGAWLIQTYRTQFSDKIQQSGVDGLIQFLTDRNKQLTSGNQCMPNARLRDPKRCSPICRVARTEAPQAALALRPIAGEFAFLLFSIGIVGTGLLALPVLAGSAAYAMAGTFKWRNSLALKPQLAKRFYGIIVLSSIIGVIIGFTPIDPIKALYRSAVINGVVSVPIMGLIMFMAVNPKIMGRFVIPARLRIAGWSATAVMTVAALTMFWFMLK
jgi:Mn2+/Fe2+ NRAMP family transporter